MLMIKFEVGKPLPLPMLTPPGQEICRVSFNEAFFDLVYWIAKSEKDAITAFTKNKLEYGVFVANEIPFFIVLLPAQKWSFDVSLNIKKVQDESVENWLNSEGNAVNMYICDWHTNELLGMRLIGIEPDTANKIRDVLERQDEKYKDSAAVDSVIQKIMLSYTTENMMMNIKMIKL